MLNQKPIDKVVFLDLESTSQYESFAAMPIRMQNLFKERFKKEIKEELLASTLGQPTESAVLEQIYNAKAPLFAEFNKIICISMGVISTKNKDSYLLQTKSFINADEKELLKEFANSASIRDYVKSEKAMQFAFCAHNGKVFDFPIIAKRMIYNGLDLPFIFDFSGKKPWDLDYIIDTKEEWKFGVYDGNVSLDLLAGAFDIESSKMIMKGSDVKDVYYIGKDMEAIKKYCEHDIFTLASIYLKMKNIQIPLTR